MLFVARMIVSRLFYTVLFLCTVKYDCEATMYEPSFVSDWYPAAAETKQTLTIDHNLGEYPVKVDIQIKINENGSEYIFSGIGSSQKDDDMVGSYGGVVYKYNKDIVELSFPYRRNGPKVSRGLAYTASDGLYHGPTHLLGPYATGHVRARMWIAIDMPPAIFTREVNMSDKDSYQEIHHNLNHYPDMVTVQTMIGNTGFMSDGIGAVFLSKAPKNHISIGGVLYGYDDTKVRLWVPSNKYGGVFTAVDGYNLGDEKFGVVKIKAWDLDCSQQVYYNRLTVGREIRHVSQLDLPCVYNVKDYFVSFQVMVPDGNGLNDGMLFYGAGTTQANGRSPYGGVVYAYNKDEILFWRPNDPNVVYIGNIWGGGKSHQASTTADIIVRIFYLPNSDCQNPERIGNSTFTSTGAKYNDTVTYSCKMGYVHTGGDLERTCGRNRRWSGVPPSCTIISCPVPDQLLNGLYTPTASVYIPDDVITYQCYSEYTVTDATVSRTCNNSGLWTGNPPLCKASGCPTSDDVHNATNTTSTVLLSTSLFSTGSVIVYSCNSGYEMTVGSPKRTCQSSEKWDGQPPACTVISCPVPDQLLNGLYTPIASVYIPDDVITYQCCSEYTVTDATVSRTCNNSGLWTGNPPLCKASGCPTPDDVHNATHTTSTVLLSTSLFSTGSVIVYSCNSGYEMTVGSPKRTCQSSEKWDGQPPACTVISCPMPDLVGNGSFTQSSAVYLPSTVITYQCDEGFCIIGGSSSRTCKSNGVWDGVPPACTACPTPFSGFDTLSNEEIEELITKLRISKNSTSSYRRSITSAHDDRKSCQMIGIGGIIFLASILCVLVLPDIFKVFTYFFMHRKA